jgi:hypothetical protein
MIILKPDTKTCMSELLLKETFDSFLLIEGTITTYNQFHIDGYLQKDFFSEDNLPTEQYSSWKQLREFCLSIIKGARTPLDFKFILSLPKETVMELYHNASFTFPSDAIQGLYLNFSYNGEYLQCITGVSFHTFILDKSLEQLWDKYTLQLFEQWGISFTLLE